MKYFYYVSCCFLKTDENEYLIEIPLKRKYLSETRAKLNDGQIFRFYKADNENIYLLNCPAGARLEKVEENWVEKLNGKLELFYTEKEWKQIGGRILIWHKEFGNYEQINKTWKEILKNKESEKIIFLDEIAYSIVHK